MIYQSLKGEKPKMCFKKIFWKINKKISWRKIEVLTKVNPDTILSVLISDLVLSFKKRVIQDASRLLTKKNYSLTVIKVKSIPNNRIWDSMLQVKVNYVITSFTSLYLHRNLAKPCNVVNYSAVNINQDMDFTVLFTNFDVQRSSGLQI